MKAPMEQQGAIMQRPPSECLGHRGDENTPAESESELELFHAAVRCEQQRKSLAARAAWLRDKLAVELGCAQRSLAPFAFGWEETPWAVSDVEVQDSDVPDEIHPANDSRFQERSVQQQELYWIGETERAESDHPPRETGDEARMWEALRHAEARTFPLENADVADGVFDSLATALTARDMDALSRQWQQRAVEQHLTSPLRDSFSDENLVLSVEAPDTSSASSSELQTKNPSNRQAQPARKLKSISQRRLEQELSAKRIYDELERQCKFRATPVPASSLLPRYDEIMRKMGNKSSDKKVQRANEIMSKIKPFSFVCNGNHDKQSILHCRCKSQSNKVIQDAIAAIEKQQEDKAKQKSTRLLSGENSLVAQAAEDGHRRRKKLQEYEQRSGLTKEHSFKPKVNHESPDFKRMQQEFEQKLEARKTLKQRIVPIPFEGLEIHERQAAEKKEERQREMLRRLDEQLQMGEFRATFPAQCCFEVPALIYKETRSSILKAVQTHGKLAKPEPDSNEKQKQYQHQPIQRTQEKDQDQKQVQKDENSQREMAAKIQKLAAAAVENKTRRAVSLKQQLRREEKQRESEYRAILKEIDRKMDRRLCLFEMVSVQNAKRQAKAKVEAILKNQHF
ncbi:hypothetical protein HDU82_005525 [Entophlyctis luteolus]|nr:hypothetical protein HDU82_005525 [Entophlyctis luteolus]